MALAGGSSLQVPQNQGYIYDEGGILSPDGRCRAFDALRRRLLLRPREAACAPGKVAVADATKLDGQSLQGLPLLGELAGLRGMLRQAERALDGRQVRRDPARSRKWKRKRPCEVLSTCAQSDQARAPLQQ